MKNKPKASKVLINGEFHHLRILRVEEWNEDGTPFMVSLMRPTDVAELSRDPDQNHFITCYMKEYKRGS